MMYPANYHMVKKKILYIHIHTHTQQEMTNNKIDKVLKVEESECIWYCFFILVPFLQV